MLAEHRVCSPDSAQQRALTSIDEASHDAVGNHAGERPEEPRTARRDLPAASIKHKF